MYELDDMCNFCPVFTLFSLCFTVFYCFLLFFPYFPTFFNSVSNQKLDAIGDFLVTHYYIFFGISLGRAV